MQFLAPQWLLLGLLALPIIALYMLKLRRKEVRVSSTLLWSAMLRDRQANTPWQRLRRNLLLFLQLLILAALTLGMARPTWPTRSIASGSLIVLLDASASMSATDVAPSRFAEAQAAVRGLIRDMESGATLTLIQVSNPPVVLASGERDPERMRQAVERASPTQGSADWSAAFAIAAGAVSAQDAETKITTVLVSDGGLPQDETLPPLPGDVRYMPVGSAESASDNLAIRALALRQEDAGPGAKGVLELFASVSNYGSAPRQVVLSFYGPGGLLQDGVRLIDVPANSSADLALAMSGLPAYVMARLSAPAGGEEQLDALPLDDVAFAVAPQPTSQVYLLTQDYVRDGNEHLALLQILWALQIEAFRPSLRSDANGTDSAPELPNETFDLYVLDGVLPIDETGAPALPSNGNLLLVNPPANPLFGISGVFTPTRQAKVIEGPLTEYLLWDKVFIASARELTGGAAFETWARVLVQDAKGRPLVLAGERQGQRIAVVTFDLHQSDLTIQDDYIVLMHNLFNYLLPGEVVNAESGATEASVRPGEAVRIQLPSYIDQIAIGLPDGSMVTGAPLEAAFTFKETAQLGLYSVNLYNSLSESPDKLRYFAVNLFDPLESSLATRAELVVGQEKVTGAQAGEVGQREIWPWLAGLGLAVLCVEWWAYHRRLSAGAPSLAGLKADMAEARQKLTSMRKTPPRSRS